MKPAQECPRIRYASRLKSRPRPLWKSGAGCHVVTAPSGVEAMSPTLRSSALGRGTVRSGRARAGRRRLEGPRATVCPAEAVARLSGRKMPRQELNLCTRFRKWRAILRKSLHMRYFGRLANECALVIAQVTPQGSGASSTSRSLIVLPARGGHHSAIERNRPCHQ